MTLRTGMRRIGRRSRDFSLQQAGPTSSSWIVGETASTTTQFERNLPKESSCLLGSGSLRRVRLQATRSSSFLEGAIPLEPSAGRYHPPCRWMTSGVGGEEPHEIYSANSARSCGIAPGCSAWRHACRCSCEQIRKHLETHWSNPEQWLCMVSDNLDAFQHHLWAAVTTPYE